MVKGEVVNIYNFFSSHSWGRWPEASGGGIFSLTLFL
jgi:hypothetical protein